MAQTHDDPNIYYVPHHSPWPFVGSITLFITMIGVANWLNGQAWGQPVFFIGLVATLAVLFGAVPLFVLEYFACRRYLRRQAVPSTDHA
mgnify:CR=1 FL=1